MLISRDQFMALTARINERYLPWLNVVQGDLTLSRLARLSLFQVSVGICFVLLNVFIGFQSACQDCGNSCKTYYKKI